MKPFEGKKTKKKKKNPLGLRLKVKAYEYISMNYIQLV